MQDARHGNGHHAGQPDKLTDISQFYADNMGKRYAKHGALEATAEFSSTGMRAHADASATVFSVMKAVFALSGCPSQGNSNISRHVR